MIQIMKASAGSGKTFNLARKYITLLFKKNDSHAYRHILAVTFTNKATDEMKSRILKELHVLATAPARSPYLPWLIPEIFPQGAQDLLQAAAKDVLSKILNDYSAFSISTIDRFFQQTLKAFSKEMGQFAAYQIELDKDSLLNETVDRVLDSLSDDNSNKDLLQWLTDTAMEQIEQGNRYNVESSLFDIAKKLKSESLRTLAEKTGIDPKELYSKDNLKNIRKVCRATTADIRKKVRESAQAVLDLLDSLGVPLEKFFRDFLKPLKDYAALPDSADLKPLSTAFLNRAADPDAWFSKANSSYRGIVLPALEGLLADFCDSLSEGNIKLFYTAKLLESQFYELGVAREIFEEFEAVLKDRNVLSIDDTNVILKQIIDGSDAPFIYEKTGVRYDNFLLDEFQDTSTVQWDNFRPLIAESASKGEENLVVGDVKQSIYRWRGSDWNLLKEEVNKALQIYGIEETVLDTNYRSHRNIVDFNNGFFPYAADYLDGKGSANGLISGIYADVCQKAAAKPEKTGAVKVTFCEAEKELDMVMETINELHSRGVPYRDMAVLVRKNGEGNEVAMSLIPNGIPVITDDSLRTKTSTLVGRIVALMSTLDNPDDELNGYLAKTLNISLPRGYNSLPELCEIICRELRQYDPEAFESQITYVYSFVDTLLDYVSKNGNDLHGFLKTWEEKDPSISSPATSDAVRIITIHKAKGLDFRYVIFPYAEKVRLSRQGNAWCHLEDDGTAFGADCHGIYDVSLSSAAAGNTFFDEDYQEDLLKQYIDNINIFYVALTRPVAGLHIIAKTPKRNKDKSISIQNFSDILCQWLSFGQKGFRKFAYGNTDALPTDTAKGAVANASDSADTNAPAGGSAAANVSEDDAVMTVFECGDFYGTTAEPGEDKHSAVAADTMLPAAYDSFPLNPPQVADDQEIDASLSPAKARLILSVDSADYFNDEAGSLPVGDAAPATSTARSARMKGIILHEILSGINTAADIGPAVNAAVATGTIEEADAPALIDFFRSKLEKVSSEGWFQDEGLKIFNETEIVDTDGTIHRPDRVIMKPDGSIVIIDYKFGSHKPAYLRQISTYADLWRRMGYASVSASLWYVLTDEILAAD